MNDKQTGAIVIIVQRLHEDDLVGHVLDRDTWDVVTLPAIAPEDVSFQLSDDENDVHQRRRGDVLHPVREPREILEQIRRAQGSVLFEAQYQQAPAPAGGNAIRREWLRYYDGDGPPEAYERIVVSWDTASTLGEDNDWSVGTVWGSVELDYYLLDVIRDRMRCPIFAAPSSTSAIAGKRMPR